MRRIGAFERQPSLTQRPRVLLALKRDKREIDALWRARPNHPPTRRELAPRREVGAVSFGVG